MDLKRLWRTFRLYTARNRNDYLRKAGIFAHFGENSSMVSRVIPLYPELIYIGNNVHLASRIHFITHDIIHHMLNRRNKVRQFREYAGCIRIDDNVFVGSNSTILANVHIGANTVIGTGTLVTKDLPGGFVYAGIPARPIGTFEELEAKRKTMIRYPQGFVRHGDSVPAEFAQWLWRDFWEQRGGEPSAPGQAGMTARPATEKKVDTK